MVQKMVRKGAKNGTRWYEKGTEWYEKWYEMVRKRYEMVRKMVRKNGTKKWYENYVRNKMNLQLQPAFTKRTRFRRPS